MLHYGQNNDRGVSMAAAEQTIRMNLDPRTKLALAALGALCCVLAPSAGALAWFYLALLIGILVAAALRGYSRWLLPVLPMALFFGLVTGLAFDARSGLMAGLKLLTLIIFSFELKNQGQELVCLKFRVT
jgi:energy-coupling factor transporter transmembrane protein EcfT